MSASGTSFDWESTVAVQTRQSVAESRQKLRETNPRNSAVGAADPSAQDQAKLSSRLQALEDEDLEPLWDSLQATIE
jgi:hypothetical protein